ncbi:MAG: DegT/DnrJ/EryC1/StrS family aminotransferase [Bacteroidales bacterium]
MKSKIWLSSPHMGSEEIRYVMEAFESNWVAPLGPHVDAFERELAQYTGARHAAALSSGTAGIHLALILLGVQAGDEVLCQSFTFSATANPIVYQGATPVFIDSESSTWNLDPNALEHAIRSRQQKGIKPKAIIAVHLYGMPALMKDIVELGLKYDIPVIEDAAEALGSQLDGKKCGTWGRLGILSFNGNKIITTSGGGALLSDDEEFIKKARFLATQARDPAPHYQHSHIGYNYRMSNVVAGIGRGQMKVLDARIAARRSNFYRYKSYFEQLNQKGYAVEMPPEPKGHFSNRWLTTIIIDPQKNRSVTRETLRLAFEQENIECRPLWKPMHLQPVFKDAPFYGSNISERLFENGLCLPSGSNLTDSDFDRIFAVLDSVFQA